MKQCLMLLLLIVVTTATAAEQRFTVPLEDSPSTGPADARITVVEFLDFQ